MKKDKAFKTTIFPAVSGNILTLYDFIIYAYFSNAIANQFFSQESPAIALIMVFFVFTLGCLVRPIGAIVFGLFGDKYGRKRTLTLSVLLMATSTFLVGILPTYQTIGIYAPITLMLCRIIQGLAMCGEEAGASVYLTEVASKNNKCYYSSMVLSSVYIGLMLASSIVLLILLILPSHLVQIWGWRIPFLLSLPLGIISIASRVNQPISPEFKQLRKEHKILRNPVYTCFKKHNKSLVKSILVSSVMAVTVYVYAAYLPSYFTNHFSISLSTTMLIFLGLFSLTAITCLISGKLSDTHNYKKMMQIGCISIIITSYPLYIIFEDGSLFNACITATILSIQLGIIAGSLMPHIIVLFPANVRFIGTAFSFNVSMALFGSTAPTLIYYINYIFDNSSALFMYLSISAIISLLTTFTYKNHKETNFGKNLTNGQPITLQAL